MQGSLQCNGILTMAYFVPLDNPISSIWVQLIRFDTFNLPLAIARVQVCTPILPISGVKRRCIPCITMNGRELADS